MSVTWNVSSQKSAWLAWRIVTGTSCKEGKSGIISRERATFFYGGKLRGGFPEST